jgi:hypothetical protein
MSYKSFKQLIALLFLVAFFSGKAIARPVPELISGFDILGIKSLVDSTLQGVAGVCPVQNEPSLSPSVVTQDNSSVKVSRLKLYERFESIQKVFTEDYLKMVAQATYNHEYCLDRPKQVEKEICEQASSILDTYKKDVLKLDEVQKEITLSNKILGSIDLGDDPFMKLIGAPKSISSLESNLKKHLRRFKSFVEASIKTFKSEFTEEDKRRIFDFHVRALGFLQRSPIQLEGQESLNNRLIRRTSKLLGKSEEETLLSEAEIKGKIYDLAVKIREKYLDSIYIAGRNDSDVLEVPNHPVMTLSRESIGQQYQKDEPIEHFEVWGERPSAAMGRWGQGDPRAMADRNQRMRDAGRHKDSEPGGGARSKLSDKEKAVKNLKKVLSKMSKEELKSLFKELGLLGDDASRSPAGIAIPVAAAIKALIAAAGAGVAIEVIKNFLKDRVKGDSDFKDVTFPPHWAVIENPADKKKENEKPNKTEVNKPPKDLEAFPDAKPVKPKTPVQGGGKLRPRWKDKKGRIYEWDYKKGEVEIYDKRGNNHEGGFDPKTGKRRSPPDKTRSVEK